MNNAEKDMAAYVCKDKKERSEILIYLPRLVSRPEKNETAPVVLIVGEVVCVSFMNTMNSLRKR